jgi:hypothetical protein
MCRQQVPKIAARPGGPWQAMADVERSWIEYPSGPNAMHSLPVLLCAPHLFGTPTLNSFNDAVADLGEEPRREKSIGDTRCIPAGDGWTA